MKWNRIAALALGLTILCACTPKQGTETASPIPSAAETGTEPADERAEVRVAMLKGPTGLGCAKLMADAADGESENQYTFTVLADATQAAAQLTNGDNGVDIAALPTNLASTLYHRTDGAVQLLALNTQGVLYVLENGNTIHSLADLRGKTVYAFGQGANPEYVLRYLLEKNGLDSEHDVDLQWRSSDEVTTLMASGEGQVCLLPVPAATAVLLQNTDVRVAVDLNDAWEEAELEGLLTMGCVVARTAFAQENPEAVDAFLREYGQSIEWVSDPENLEQAAALAEQGGIVPSAAVAQRALPDANLCFLTGGDMMAAIQGYYQVLYAADKASIGGSIPDGAFYYMYESGSAQGQ